MLPLDNRPFSELVFERPRPVADRSRYVYYPGAVGRARGGGGQRPRPRPPDRATRCEPPGRRRRPRASCWPWAPDSAAGRSTSTTGGRPTPTTSSPWRSSGWRRTERVPPGRHQVAYVFERTGPHRGVGHLAVDGVEVARVDIPRFTLTKFSVTGAGLTCGYSDGLPVTRRYRAPFRFTGTLERGGGRGGRGAVRRPGDRCPGGHRPASERPPIDRRTRRRPCCWPGPGGLGRPGGGAGGHGPQQPQRARRPRVAGRRRPDGRGA